MPALSFLPEAPRHLLSTSSPSWSPDIQVLDLTATDTDLRGFSGGFASGGYGYFVPWKPSDYSGKVARVDLANFSQVQVLDLTTTDPDLKGFIGGFASGDYAYFVPYLHRDRWPLLGSHSGRVARVDHATFSEVQVLDLTATDPDLKGFVGGFASDGYGYFVPNHSADGFSDFSGKAARVDLATFAQVQVLDLTATDPDLKGFAGGFASGDYGYFVPHNNGANFGKVARVDLATFSEVQVLDLTATDPGLKGFFGGFASADYGYFVPSNNGDSFGKVARVDLATFSKVQVLDLTYTDPDLRGFQGGFASGGYGYFVPYRTSFLSDGISGKVARVDLATFSEVQVLDLTTTDPDLKGFFGGFASGDYGYFVPFNNYVPFPRVHFIVQSNAPLIGAGRVDKAYFGKVVRIDLSQGSFPLMTLL